MEVHNLASDELRIVWNFFAHLIDDINTCLGGVVKELYITFVVALGISFTSFMMHGVNEIAIPRLFLTASLDRTAALFDLHFLQKISH
jgi:hypothetical protein